MSEERGDSLRRIPPKPDCTVSVDVTLRCNHACPYCFQRNSGWASRSYEDGSIPWRRVFEKFNALNGDCKTVSVTLTGGEPFLYPDRMLSIVSAAKSVFGNRMRVDIFTNGSMIDWDTLRKITRIADTGVTITPHAFWLDYRRGGQFEGVVKNNFDQLIELFENGVLYYLRVNVVLSTMDGVIVQKYAPIVRDLVKMRYERGYMGTGALAINPVADAYTIIAGDLNVVDVQGDVLDAIFPIFRRYLDDVAELSMGIYNGFEQFYDVVYAYVFKRPIYRECYKSLSVFAHFSQSGYVIPCPLMPLKVYLSGAATHFRLDDWLDAEIADILANGWRDPFVRIPDFLAHARISHAIVSSKCAQCPSLFCPAIAYFDRVGPHSEEQAKVVAALSRSVIDFHENLLRYAINKGYAVRMPGG